jgi:hypothetical protein
MKFYLDYPIFSFFLVAVIFFLTPSRFLGSPVAVRRQKFQDNLIASQEDDLKYTDDSFVTINDSFLGTYDIERSAVSVSQYAAFLNAVVLGQDVHNLYHPEMASLITCRSDTPSSGEYYSVVEGKGNEAINFVNFYDAVRFCNWKEHGEPNQQGVIAYSDTYQGEVTEEGSYTIKNNQGQTIIIDNNNAIYHLPTSDQLSHAFIQQNIFSNSLSEWVFFAEQNIPSFAYEDEQGILKFKTNISPLITDAALGFRLVAKTMITKSLSPDSRNNTSVAQKSVTFEKTSALKQEDNVALKTSVPNEYWKKKDARIVLDVATPLAMAGNMYVFVTLLTEVCPEALLVVGPVSLAMRCFDGGHLLYDLFSS